MTKLLENDAKFK
jgi:hypothetical protein